MAAAMKTPAMKATISGNVTSNGGSASFTWTNTVVVTGGSGSYTYTWQFDYQDGYAWSLGSYNAATTGITVQLVQHGDIAQAGVSCVVYDTVTGKYAYSNEAQYLYSRS